MTDWTPEEDEAFNNVEKNSNLGKQILRDMGQPYVYEPKREWVGLTDEEIKDIIGPWGDTPIKGYTRQLFDKIEAKLRSKNT
jgi:hypothetical protein